MVGGISSLCGASIIGPRRGRFDAGPPGPDGRTARKRAIPMPGHSNVLLVMGTFILWVGWYGFNAGSTGAMNAAHAVTAARVTVTTTLSASSGGIVAVMLIRFLGVSRSWDVPTMCNGVLAGLVSITAGCATLSTWAAALTGAIGATLFVLASKALLRLAVDDPLDATNVHGVCGAWGLIAAALFSTDEYTRLVYGPDIAPGLFYPPPEGKSAGDRLGCAIIFICVTAMWVGLAATAIFSTLSALGMLRAPEKLGEAEIDLDASIIPVSYNPGQHVVSSCAYDSAGSYGGNCLGPSSLELYVEPVGEGGAAAGAEGNGGTSATSTMSSRIQGLSSYPSSQQAASTAAASSGLNWPPLSAPPVKPVQPAMELATAPAPAAVASGSAPAAEPDEPEPIERSL